MSDLTIASLSKLYDEILDKPIPPIPIAALLPIQRRFNDVANMMIEQFHIPVYRSAWIGGPVRGIKPRSAYKTRRGYKRALRYWRGWDRMMDRTQEKVGYLFMEQIDRMEGDLLRRTFGSPVPKVGLYPTGESR